jgi:hypothetical protein
MRTHLRTTVLPLVVIGLAIVPAAAQRASGPPQPGAPSSTSGIDPAAMDRTAGREGCAFASMHVD